jgi:glycogen operon protein
MGDEVRRTQHGNNNGYCHDDETCWFDWTLLKRHGDVRRFVERLVSHRLHLVSRLRWHEYQTLNDFLREARIQIHGVKLDQPDWGDESHSLAFTARGPAGGMFHIMINAYREALAFELPPSEEGWRRWIDTSCASPDDICELDEAPPIAGAKYLVQSHSIVCLLESG